MKPEQLDIIAERSAIRLKELIGESNTEIREAIQHALEESNDAENETGAATPAKVSLTHKLEIDLLKNTQLDRLSWSVLHKQEIVSELPDPNQPELDME